MSLSESFAPKSTAGAVRSDPYRNTKSLEFGFRARRFAKIRRLIEAILREKGEADILDLGGTERYWDVGGDFIARNSHRLRITLVNTEDHPVERSDLFQFIIGSATDPDLLGDRRFDLVHSNSVIEHVGHWHDMEMFAHNTRRLAPRYYVQTPNYWFPYEPHFRFPAFQYLPAAVRVQMIKRFSLGFFSKIATTEEARDIVDHHRLVSAAQMRRFFPDATVSYEKIFGGLNKSIIATRDTPRA